MHGEVERVPAQAQEAERTVAAVVEDRLRRSRGERRDSEVCVSLLTAYKLKNAQIRTHKLTMLLMTTPRDHTAYRMSTKECLQNRPSLQPCTPPPHPPRAVSTHTVSTSNPHLSFLSNLLLEPMPSCLAMLACCSGGKRSVTRCLTCLSQ